MNTDLQKKLLKDFEKEHLTNNIQNNVINQNKDLIEVKNKNEVFLEVNNLRKQYNKKAKPAVNNISFKVLAGEFHAFIGANGAGKTTTIKSIVGAYAEFEGEIKISGISNREKSSRLKLGYIPESARFPSKMSSYLYLKSMAELNGLTPKEAKEFTERILKEFNMWNLRNVSPNKFSSGQKKKILLAQSLSNNPDLLIMDEPTANLDPKSRIAFFEILKDLQSKGKSIFISSHILSELDIYANALTILDGGKIVFTGKRNQDETKNKEIYKLVTETELSNKLNSRAKTLKVEIKDYHSSEANTYIVSSETKKSMNEFIKDVMYSNRIVKFEKYHLSIEELYKKFVILGSVHTNNQADEEENQEIKNKQEDKEKPKKEEKQKNS
ncbi:ABC transporter ATP-binding protein [Malacoplasma iowae]|uniref:ABC exporter ATP-binding subunit n=2 Tax=Malacoplasma iowae TaxID=2116 RepID=A0A084U3D5_MALIO|nr:ABC transporter ATP-binding protein [Malacoplasma iowae]KFB07471.1 ABC exporter ATP-binding subunit [Malacoplasma iowae DK-CPA]WPL37712.1 ABC transporter ATP-binding protein [Malacoplasma iowae]WPL40726.1 ABC transporter ATP-binding protein [Malacoplasma iowae]